MRSGSTPYLTFGPKVEGARSCAGVGESGKGRGPTRCATAGAALLGLLLALGAYPHCAHGQEKETVTVQGGLYYTVQKGDTLWDLSERFFDTPDLWPELWQRNRELPNPHLIYPGQVLRLFETTEEKSLKPGEAVSEKVAVVPAPVERPVRTYHYPGREGVGFVRKAPVSPLGSIFKVDEDKFMISENDLVYLEINRPGDRVVGKRFTVFRTAGSVPDPDNSGGRKSLGVQHLVLGRVLLTKVHPWGALGRVEVSFRPMQVGDLLMDYTEAPPEILMVPAKEGFEGRVLMSEERSSAFAQGDIVFIDKGKKDNVEVGQAYAVYYREAPPSADRSRLPRSLPPVDFGQILILRTEATTATALVTHSHRSLRPGTRFRSMTESP